MNSTSYILCWRNTIYVHYFDYSFLLLDSFHADHFPQSSNAMKMIDFISCIATPDFFLHSNMHINLYSVDVCINISNIFEPNTFQSFIHYEFWLSINKRNEFSAANVRKQHKFHLNYTGKHYFHLFSTVFHIANVKRLNADVFFFSRAEAILSMHTAWLM